MSTQHTPTPGPWQHDGNGNIDAMRPHGVIAVALIDGEETGNLADADLIAAAPDLLAALQMYERYRNRSRGDWSEVDAAARAAITKAEGR